MYTFILIKTANFVDSEYDLDKKNSNKSSKWFKTPNKVKAKETTRPRFVRIFKIPNLTE
jgi:hypothetical protein